MDSAPHAQSDHRPGPPRPARPHRRDGSSLRVWSSDADPCATLEEVESTLRDATRELREIRCLIDRLGAIPLGAHD